MAKQRLTEAERLHRHNEEMKLALAENVSVLEARRRLNARRWREFEATLERRRRCGTSAAEKARLPDFPPSRLVRESDVTGGREPRFWWERD